MQPVTTTTTTAPSPKVPSIFDIPDAGAVPGWVLRHTAEFLVENPGRTVLIVVGLLVWFMVAVVRSAIRP